MAPADYVFPGGPVITVTGPPAEAVALSGERILAVGSQDEVHADSPMYPPEPLRLVRTAVTRRTRSGDGLAPAESWAPQLDVHVRA